MLTLAVAGAAGIGAVARYLLDLFVQQRSHGELPYGTALINVTGSLVLGLVTGLAMHAGLSAAPTLVIGTGFAGGYTTLSTWAVETLALVEDREALAAVTNVVGSFAAGLAAGALGLGLALL